MSICRRFVVVPCLLLAAFVAPATCAPTAYVATPIPALGGASVYVTGINASGAVTGWSYTNGATIAHAFVFAVDGTLTDLMTLGGAQSFAQGISDVGDVAGTANPPSSNAQHAFRRTGGTMTDIHPFAGIASTGNAINASGVVAGVYTSVSGRSRAFVDAAGVFSDLGTLGGDSATATAINVFGSSAGHARRGDGAVHAFKAEGGALQDLGTLGGSESHAFGLNASGDVAGDSTTTGDAGPHAFVHANGAMQDLGTLGGATSSALAINAAGIAVGTAADGGGAPRAFVYADGAMRDLNAQVVSGLGGAVLTDAVAINDAGQVAARACVASTCRSFRLDPVALPAVQAIEYYHAAFDHYFVTAIPDEIAKLDNGTFAGWARTGQSFAVQAGPQAGTNPVCRFFSTSFAPKSSHFYTPYADECAIVRRNADWQFEGIVFYIATPDVAGNCPAGTQPVYRLYNNGMGGAPNHRYTTSLTLRAQMIVLGWVPEGLGPQAVGMCAR